MNHTSARTRRNRLGSRPRPTAVVASLSLALAGLVLMASPANAALSAGPTDPGAHPDYFTDSVTGLSLEPCFAAEPLCLPDPDLTPPDGEAFYFVAEASLGDFDMEMALEAAWADPTTPDVFQRFQILGPMQVGTTYRVTHPWGIWECVPDRTARCREDFASPTGGPIQNWLLPAAGVPGNGFLSTGAAGAVTGSPSDFNKLRIEHPSITTSCVDPAASNCVETSVFTLFGQIVPGVAASVSPNSLAFGNVGAPTALPVTYRSNGTEPAEVGTVTSSNPAFTATKAAGCASVASGNTCEISVTYNPVAGQSATGTLTIADNTDTDKVVTVSGSSIANAVPSTTSLSFGNQKLIDDSTTSQPVTVTNDGFAPLTVLGASSSNPEFPVDASTCTAAPVPAEGSCVLTVAFGPDNLGARVGTLTVDTNANDPTVALSGTGTQAVLTAADALSFGNTNTGSARNLTLAVTNTGTAPMTLGPAPSLSGPHAADFNLGGAVVQPCTSGMVVPVDGVCRVGVGFRPRAVGARSAALTVTGDGVAHVVSLTGQGVDTAGPRVAQRSPAAGATRVRRGANVVVVLNEAAVGVNRVTFRLTRLSGGPAIGAVVTRGPNARTWVLNPARNLGPRTRYVVTLVGGPSAIRDAAGNPLATTRWGFRTR